LRLRLMIRRGARRFDSRSRENGLHHVAVENPDGQRVLVVTNPGPAGKMTLKVGKKTAELAVDADCIATLAWS
jgi:O-glycosyl hydrolase